MSDSTLFPVSSQTDFENLPLPERIAHIYGFALAYHDVDGQRYYAVQDWLTGVAQASEPRVFLAMIKHRLRKAGIELNSLCRKLPYKATNQKTYQLDFVTAETLNTLLKFMSIKTGLVSVLLTGQPYGYSQIQSGYVYLLGADEIPDKYKIGITENIHRRIHDLQVTVPVTIRVLHLIPCDNMREEEKRLHKLFKSKRLIGEWFALNDRDIEYIQSIRAR